MEIWKTISDFPHYEVSDLGRVRRIKTFAGRIFDEPRMLTPFTQKQKYWAVTLTDNGRRRRSTVHQLVMQAFVGPCPEGLETRHLDGNGKNNRLDNLSYGTHKENYQDLIRHDQAKLLKGYDPKIHPPRPIKLTADAVIRARTEYATGNTSMPKLAKKHGVSVSFMQRVIWRTAWKHLP